MVPQTKILDGGTKRCVCVFEVLFKGVSTRFGLPPIENSFKNALRNALFSLQNLRLGTINNNNRHFLLSGCTIMDTKIMTTAEQAFYGSQTAVGNSSPIFDNPAFSRFSQKGEPRFVVEIIGKIVKRQVCQNGG